MLDDSPGDGETVKRRGAAADFIEKDEARRSGVMQDGGNFTHLDEKRRTAAREIVAGADARKDAGGNGKLGLTSRNERAHLRHQNNQRGLAKVGGFAAHVRAGDQQELLAAGVEAKIVGNESLAALAEKFFDDGVTASNDKQLSGSVEFRSGVPAVGGQLCKRSKHVQLRNGGSCAAEPRGLGGDGRTNLHKKLSLDFENAFVRRENFALVLF